MFQPYTVNDIIRLSAKNASVLGTGQTLNSADTNDLFRMFNAMLAQWTRKRWLTFHLMDTGIQSTGNPTYSVGIGGDFNIPRTNQLNAAFVRLLPVPQGGPIDLPLQIIETYEEFSAITMKQIGTIPCAVFLDTGYPFGTAHFYPVPPAGMYQVHIITKSDLPQFQNLTDVILLPPEYIEALIWNLSLRACGMFGNEPSELQREFAIASLETIKNANTQIRNMAMPNGLPGSGRQGRWAGHGVGKGWGQTW